KYQSFEENYGFISRGKYYTQLTKFFQHFNKEQILVFFYEDNLKNNPQETLKQTCQFIGVEPNFDFPNYNRQVNASDPSLLLLTIDYYLPKARSLTRKIKPYLPSTKIRPQENTIRQLYELYQPENEKLFQLLGRSCASWQYQL
ncbi:MAG: sulfotransferase domain-containing protein, partial [Okeania sp. SIO2D1]|nr:sulfotransferase domain-containing protein [Okeania sp. SIO2D1]